MWFWFIFSAFKQLNQYFLLTSASWWIYFCGFFLPCLQICSRLFDCHCRGLHTIFGGFFPIGWMNTWIGKWVKIFGKSSGPFHRAFYLFQPISRPLYVQQYKITAYSLYAAASTGLSTEEIVKNLSKFCKTNLPDEVVSFIKVVICDRRYSFW